ncbi:hypothetical protein CBG60_09965 [Fusobacterium animalis]|uniref:Uncharacterized protein n=1 Tax=Fusobacterium animalis 7_1 TaxID=457405 RepID=A0A140PSH3_9FUSO|nr:MULTISPECIES: hypothetical protein [Fusobacterium]ASG31497.1 hypothetical protein CBG60_09965 [Fusobacterium animalis]EEO42302.1 hypothetical protein FSDG_00861 [Fusobacterium animalis 7_1]EPC07933.1 hypothetical protein HMPREF9369_02741 [Fusobacterium polymorphum F0401]
MLNQIDRENINKAIDKIIKNIKEALQQIDKPIKVRLEELKKISTNITITESKMLLSDMCGYLRKETLKKEIFKNIDNKLQFDDLDMFDKIDNKFIFEIPNSIDYKNGEELKKALTQSGIIFTTGGIVSVIIKSLVPVSIGLILAGVWYYTAQKNENIRKEKMNEVTNKYLKNIKISLQEWVKSIEKYYDEEVDKLEKELKDE